MQFIYEVYSKHVVRLYGKTDVLYYYATDGQNGLVLRGGRIVQRSWLTFAATAVTVYGIYYIQTM